MHSSLVESPWRRWLVSLGLGSLFHPLRRWRNQLRPPGLNPDGSIPDWRYQRWLNSRSLAISQPTTVEGFEWRTPADALMDESAGTALAEYSARYPEADCFYTDEDELDAKGRHVRPRFKPGWSPEFLLATNYVGGAVAIRRDLSRRLGATEGEFDLILKAMKSANQIVHIPRVLLHRRKPRNAERDLEFLRTYLERCSIDALVEPSVIPDGWHLRRRLNTELRISAVIPNRDHPEMLRRCLAALPIDHDRFEVLIVENGSQLSETRQLYDQWRVRSNVRILEWSDGFNYSQVNNWAANQATGDLLLFMNNDVEAVSADWWRRLAELAQLSSVGAVGAKLLYPNRTVQHAGVAVGVAGVGAHVHQFLPATHPGWLGRLQLTHNVSAVTGACLMIRREAFHQVGGFDARFAVAFNDIDLCLRLLERGLRNVIVPAAELIHHESITRGEDDTPEKAARLKTEVADFAARWSAFLKAGDPYFSPHFRRDRSDCCLRSD